MREGTKRTGVLHAPQSQNIGDLPLGSHKVGAYDLASFKCDPTRPDRSRACMTRAIRMVDQLVWTKSK